MKDLKIKDRKLYAAGYAVCSLDYINDLSV